MKNKTLRVLSMVMIFALLMAQVAYAKPQGVGRGREFAPGQLKKMEGYMDFSQSRIRVRNRWIESGQPPVLKQNRTLIPVRAITEALGCDVLWFDPYAVIINPEEDMVIVFDLSENLRSEDGKTYIIDSEDEDFDELLTLLQSFDKSAADEEETEEFYDDFEDYLDEENIVPIDVAPGLINNSTYVPVRFIAETFGLRVSYDDDTKEIDIDDEADEPIIDPEKMEIEEPKDVSIEIMLNNHVLMGIWLDDEILEEDEDYTTTTGSSITVKLLKEYIEDLNSEEHEFTFVFENEDEEEVQVEFELKLEYLDELPELSQESITFDEGEFDESDYADIYGNLIIELELNNWAFDRISGLEEDEDYLVSNDGNEVSIAGDFFNDLDEGDYELQFVFEIDDLVYVSYLEVEVE